MSYERKIASQGLPVEVGPRLDPTPERKIASLEIKGGQPTLDDRGHEDRGQRIHHRLEMRTQSYTTIRGTDIKPGEFSRHVVRADGTLEFSLSKPPSVPEKQQHPTAGARLRQWEIEVLIYFASDTDVTWPSELKWGHNFDEKMLESGEQVLTLGASPAPRSYWYPAQSTACFRFTYWEATGDWFAEEL